MPLTYIASVDTMSPSFISSDGTCNSSNPVWLTYTGTSTAPAAIADIKTGVNLCTFTKNIAKDVYNSVADATNESLRQIASAMNQTLDVLRCLGYNQCELAGPSSCCPTSGGATAKITLRLPRNLTGQNVGYTINNGGILEGGNIDNGNNVIIPGIKSNSFRFL
jgi:hypothetical protein